MSAPAASGAAAGPALGGAARLGPVHLTVSDLDRAAAWYEEGVGLRPHARRDGKLAMGAGEEEDVLVLHGLPGARRAGRHAGLFHVALLLPSRAELARALRRLVAARVEPTGASDHGTHEAIYLRDPDGNGIELAADRPRADWPAPSAYAAGPAPLDAASLAGEAADAAPRHAGPGLRVGHVHLHVGALDEAEAFYRALGLHVTARMAEAVFLAAGDYHHHVAANLWRGRGVPPAPPDAVGLRHWTLLPGGPGELEALRARLAAAGVALEDRDGGLLARDPSGNAVLALPEDPPRLG